MIEPTPQPATERIAPFDGLRALAAVSVVAFHMGLSFAVGGVIGVNWFFVLSAYLITTILIGQLETHGDIDFRKFMMRRLSRLVPALLVLVSVVLLTLVLFARERLASTLREALATVLYISNITSFNPNATERFFGHTWSLSLEMQFYLVLPFVLRAVWRRKWSHRQVAVGAVVVSVICATVRTIGLMIWGEVPLVVHNPLLDLHLFGTGIALAYALRPGTWPQVAAWLTRRTIPMICMVWTLADIYLQPRWPRTLGPVHDVITGLCIAVVLGHVLVALDGPLARVLAWRPLAALGLMSYSLYLWHFPIFELFTDGVLISGHGMIRNIAKLGLSFFVSYASYRFIERPILQRRTSAPRRSLVDPVPAGQPVR